MHHRLRRVITALIATAVLLVTLGTASANKLSVSDRNIDIHWAALTFTPNTGTEAIRCPVTLLGSFHSSTASKVTGALVGHVTHAAIRDASCTGGSAQARTESLPWHVRYERFAGTLPNIMNVTASLENATFLIQQTILGSTVSCTATSSPAENRRGIINLSAGVATSITAESDNLQLNDFGSSTLCDNFFGNDIDGRVSGNGSVTTLTGGSLSIRLI